MGNRFKNFNVAGLIQTARKVMTVAGDFKYFVQFFYAEFTVLCERLTIESIETIESVELTIQ